MATNAKQMQNADGENASPASARKLSGCPQKEEQPERRGNWFVSKVIPLVALFASQACGAGCADNASNTTDAEEEADSEHGDSETGREDAIETPDVEVVEDAGPDANDTPDVDDTPDTPIDIPEAVEGDAEPDTVEATDSEAETPADVPDEAEDISPDTPTDVPDVLEDGEAAECISTVTERRETISEGPDLCGGTQTLSNVFEDVTWVGSGCESTGTTSTFVGIENAFSPELAVSGLACARGHLLQTINGDQVVLALSEAGRETAIEIICADLGITGTLDSGRGYSFRETDVRADQAVGMLMDGSGGFINTRLYGTGYQTAGTMGLMAGGFDPAGRTARVCFIELPTIVVNNGDTETMVSDGTAYTYGTVSTGTGVQRITWTP